MPAADASSVDERAAAARRLLRAAVEERACPAVAIEVGRRQAPLWTEAFGRLTYDSDAAACSADTVFDLASLTKVVSTASIAMQAVAAGQLDLETQVRKLSPHWRGEDRADVTLRHLLDHSSGLPAHRALWREVQAPADVESAIAALPLDRPPGTAAVYSDVGFILVGLLLERALGARLDELFAPIGRTLGPTMGFCPSPAIQARLAPTEFDPWRGRLLVGEVHDENAALLRGVAGHAGLFGTVQEVGAFARLVLATFEGPTIIGTVDAMRTFAARSRVPQSSRALAWDTMLPTSSCGTKLSGKAIGHTGFTGTSLWLDPSMDLYVALVSNRVHPSRANTRFQALRPDVHDAVVDGFSAFSGTT